MAGIVQRGFSRGALGHHPQSGAFHPAGSPPEVTPAAVAGEDDDVAFRNPQRVQAFEAALRQCLSHTGPSVTFRDREVMEESPSPVVARQDCADDLFFRWWRQSSGRDSAGEKPGCRRASRPPPVPRRRTDSKARRPRRRRGWTSFEWWSSSCPQKQKGRRRERAPG